MTHQTHEIFTQEQRIAIHSGAWAHIIWAWYMHLAEKPGVTMVELSNYADILSAADAQVARTLVNCKEIPLEMRVN